jgi:hypothetical protein
MLYSGKQHMALLCLIKCGVMTALLLCYTCTACLFPFHSDTTSAFSTLTSTEPTGRLGLKYQEKCG